MTLPKTSGRTAAIWRLSASGPPTRRDGRSTGRCRTESDVYCYRGHVTTDDFAENIEHFTVNSDGVLSFKFLPRLRDAERPAPSRQ